MFPLSSSFKLYKDPHFNPSQAPAEVWQLLNQAQPFEARKSHPKPAFPVSGFEPLFALPLHRVLPTV